MSAHERLEPESEPTTPVSPWTGAAIGLIVAALLVWAWAQLPSLVSAAGIVSFLSTTIQLVLVLGLSFGLSRLVGLLGASKAFTWAILATILLFITFGPGPSIRAWLMLFVMVTVGGSAAGAATSTLAQGSFGALRNRTKAMTTIAAVGSTVVVIGGLVWLLWAGPQTPPPAAAAESGNIADTVDLPSDPSAAGPFEFETLAYGSGGDRHRSEYGADADIVTESVDATGLLEGWDGVAGWSRTRYWGFDETALPLDGRVWIPTGDGPFPLVVMEHGDSRSDQFSDGGFDYLGEHLASRGFIALSIDANFLNTSESDTVGGLHGAAPTRAWLILEHLRLWHDWNADPDNRFAGLVDTDHIALLGHSRAGEAVAVAAQFNRESAYPEDPTVAFDYGYHIETVIALAPVDRQYEPNGHPAELGDSNYLVVQGSHDADIRTFAGLAQYDRIDLDPTAGRYKAAVYLHRANHSQFNTTWGRYDIGDGVTERFISTAALLDPGAQQRVTKGYVAAFLELTLHDDEGYWPVFTNPDSGPTWHPDETTRIRYDQAATVHLGTFDEDDDQSTGTQSGTTIELHGFETSEESELPTRFGRRPNRALHVSWTGGNDSGNDRPGVSVSFDPETAGPTLDSTIQFAMADAGTATDDELVLATIEVTDAEGNTATLPLDRFRPLPPQLDGQYLKAAILHDDPTHEPILQTYSYPVAAFADANPDLDPTAISGIDIRFSQPGRGSIYLDDIGIGDNRVHGPAGFARRSQ